MKRPLFMAAAALLVAPGLAASARAEEPAAANTTARAAAPDLNRVRSLIAAGRYKDALPLAEAAVAAAPDNAAAHALVGQIQTRLENPAIAVLALEKATTLDPKNATVFTHLGDAQMVRTMAELGKWLKENGSSGPTGGGTITTAAQMYERRGIETPGTTFPGSIMDADDSGGGLDKMNAKEWARFEAMGKDALAAYTSALALRPGDRKATQGKGLAQLVLGDWKGTVAAWEEAGVPAFDPALYAVARAVHDTRDAGEEAMRIWELASESDPTNPWAYWYIRDLYDEERRGDFRRDYHDAMRTLFADRLKDPSARGKKTPKDARKALETFTGKHADFAPGWRGLGMTLLVLKDRKAAAEAFQKAAALNPNDGYSLLQLGVLQLNEKDNAAAQQTLSKAAKARPEDAVAWHALGTAAERNKDLDSAVAFYERAAELNPGWSDAHWSLGALLLDRRQGAEALPHLERYLELEPNASNAKEVREAIEQVKAILAKSSGG